MKVQCIFFNLYKFKYKILFLFLKIETRLYDKKRTKKEKKEKKRKKQSL